MSDEKLRELPSFQADQIKTLYNKITALEKNCEGSFAKVEDHVERVLKVIDIQTQSIDILQEKIEELGGFEQKTKMLLEDFKEKQTHAIDNQIVFNKGILEQIAELRNQIQNNSIVDLNHYNALKEKLNEVAQNRIGWEEKIEEVLRDYMKYMKNFNPQSWKEVNKLLEKLDSKTEKKEVDCGFVKEGYYVNVFREIKPIPKLDSAGIPDKCEECGGYRMGERMMHNDWCSQCTTSTTAEKPPEPKWCDTCEDRLSCAFYTAGEKCTKPKEKTEPEED